MGQTRSFIKNLFFEQSKRITLVGIAILYSFFIANFLGPADYGLVVYFINLSASITNLWGVFFIQGMINVFIPKYKSKKLFYKLLKIQYAIIIPIVLGLFFFSENIVLLLGKDNPVILQWAASLLLVMPIYTSYLYLTKAFKKFGVIFKSETAMSAINFCLAFTFILLLQQGMLGVIYAQLIAALLGLSFLVYFSRSFKFEEQKMPKNELKKYVMPGLPGTFIVRAHNLANNIMLGIFVDNIMLGFYYLVKKMTDVLIGTSMSVLQTVLMPYAMEKREDKKTLGNFISLNIKMGLIMSAVLGFFTMFLGSLALQLLFPEYANGYILIPFFIINSMTASLNTISQVFMAINKLTKSVIALAAGIIVGLAVALILVSEFGIFGILTGLILKNLVSGALLYYYSHKVGVHIEIIPRKKDFKFFMNNIINVKNAIKEKFDNKLS